jgi:hypothetical protein
VLTQYLQAGNASREGRQGMQAGNAGESEASRECRQGMQAGNAGESEASIHSRRMKVVQGAHGVRAEARTATQALPMCTSVTHAQSHCTYSSVRMQAAENQYSTPSTQTLSHVQQCDSHCQHVLTAVSECRQQRTRTALHLQSPALGWPVETVGPDTHGHLTLTVRWPVCSATGAGSARGKQRTVHSKAVHSRQYTGSQSTAHGRL